MYDLLGIGIQQNTGTVDKTKILLPTPPDLEQLDCPRFAYMDFTRNGLGHRLSELVFGLQLATKANATYILDTKAWTLNGGHGNYSWLLDLLPLHNHYITMEYFDLWKRVKQGLNMSRPMNTITGQWKHILINSKIMDCNVIFRAKLKKCCERTLNPRNDCYCTGISSHTGAFEEQKELLRSIWKESTYRPPHELLYYSNKNPRGNNSQDTNDNRMVSIVWHVRLGDIVLRNDKEYFGTIASQIANSFRESNSSTPLLPFVVVMGEGGKDAILQHFDFWPELCYQYFNDRCVYPDLDVQETLYHMVQSADILVTSGSSFPATAAMLRSNGITLATMPMEGLTGIFGVSENIDIDVDGRIPEIGKLTAYIESLSSEEQKVSTIGNGL